MTNPISSSSSAALQAMKAATQEATETAATTKTEAAKGDQVAIRRLAKLQAATAANKPVEQQEQQPDQTPNDDGTGRVLKAQA